MPSTAGTDIESAEIQQSAHLPREVVGTVIEMGPYRTGWFIEPLEEKLERGAGIVVPLTCELG